MHLQLAYAPAPSATARARAAPPLCTRGALLPRRAARALGCSRRVAWRRVRAGGAAPAAALSDAGEGRSGEAPAGEEPVTGGGARGPLPRGSRSALAAACATLLGGAALPAALAAARGEALGTYASHYEMLGLLLGFAVVHSGLASARARAVEVVGERLYRVFFALASLPAAGFVVAFFIAHRYDGAALWAVQGAPGAAPAVAVVTAVSFALLYPATFDLAQVAAVRRPRLTLFEEGVIRVSRHPQLWGQVLWCVAHSAWLGSSFALVASAGLVAHHLFGVWNGDRRLRERFGEEWERHAERTSIIPFAAVADGRQKLDWREFARPAYAGVALFVWATMAAHPAMLRAVGQFHL